VHPCRLLAAWERRHNTKVGFLLYLFPWRGWSSACTIWDDVIAHISSSSPQTAAARLHPAITAPPNVISVTAASIWNNGDRMRPPLHAHLSFPLQTKSGRGAGKP
jgi:hypothetical protein